MRTRWLFTATLFTLTIGSWHCATVLAADKPCQQIRQACLNAGFVEGAAKQGNGLVLDCLGPIMKGTAQPVKASKTLPTIDAQVIAACHTADPNFGSGQGTASKTAAPTGQPPAPPGAPLAAGAAPAADGSQSKP